MTTSFTNIYKNLDCDYLLSFFSIDINIFFIRVEIPYKSGVYAIKLVVFIFCYFSAVFALRLVGYFT
jgi:hypothetical protein